MNFNSQNPSPKIVLAAATKDEKQPILAGLNSAQTPPNGAQITSDGAQTPSERVKNENGKEVVLAEQWPTLRRAMGKYSERVAEEFTQKAYEHVEGGIIRQDGRRELALAAKQMEIRQFDAQLLIACAVRKWAMDRRYDASPSPEAPRLSAEYKAWGLVWKRIGLVIGAAAVVDGIILWKLLS